MGSLVVIDESVPFVVTAGVVVLKAVEGNVAAVTAVARVDVGVEAGVIVVGTRGGQTVPGGQSISSVESEQSK